jgi:REP element-mobilizing transposase RayT
VRRPTLTAAHPLHVTIRFAAGLPSLREPVLLARVRDALRAGKERFGLRVCHYSVQGNHMHLIVEASSRRALTLGMRGVGVRIARGVNAALGRSGRIIGDRYHARALESPRATRNALAYVLLNAARHGGRSMRMDPASSGAVFDGWRIPPLPRASSPPGDVAGDVADTVVAPAVWLLRTAWRRGGLLDPRAVPGAAR